MRHPGRHTEPLELAATDTYKSTLTEINPLLPSPSPVNLPNPSTTSRLQGGNTDGRNETPTHTHITTGTGSQGRLQINRQRDNNPLSPHQAARDTYKSTGRGTITPSLLTRQPGTITPSPHQAARDTYKSTGRGTITPSPHQAARDTYKSTGRGTITPSRLTNLGPLHPNPTHNQLLSQCGST